MYFKSMSGKWRANGAGLIFFLSFLTLVLHRESCNAQGLESSLSEIFKKWEDSIPKLIESQKINGLAIAVADETGMLWSKGFGYTDISHSREVDANTLFSVQSMSKNFTALAILNAVEDGILDLDCPIAFYLPDFKVNSRFDSLPQEKITLRLLLSHRAGFAHEAPVGNNYYTEGSFEDHIKSISDTWLRFPVGQRYSYSNLGIDLAGHILEVKSGMTFESYVENHILKPSGLTRSSFNQKEIIKESNRARGYSAPDTEAPFHYAMIPSGGLYSSVTDLSHYLGMMINNGMYGNNKIAEPESLKAMFEIPGKLPDQISGYGLGISIRNDYGLTLLTHGGAGLGFCSNVLWSPEYKTGVVFLSNSTNTRFQNSLPLKILFEIIKAKTGIQLVEEFPNVSYNDPEREVDSLILKRISGTYLYNRSGVMILEYQNGRLGTKPEGPEFFPAIFTSETEFNFGMGPFPTFFSIFEGTNEKPGYLVRHFDGEYLDFNESPFDKPGPSTPEWGKYTGNYSYYSQGKLSSNKVPVTIKNGYLYVFNYKLMEYRPGLFFTSHGETLDFRGSNATWRNIRLEKADAPPQ